MGSQSRSSRRQLRPNVERVEPRVVMSVLALMSSTRAVHASSAAVSAASEETRNQVLNPTGTPTARQQRRMAFQAKMSGTWSVGPARFSTEARQYHLIGRGSSNMFLHGTHQTLIIIPSDPSTPATGLMTLVDRNLNNGAQLGLRMTAVDGAVDGRGRPTRFTYVVDQTISSGTFVAGLGTGTIEVRYGAAKRPGRGPATVLVRGTVYGTNTTNTMLNGQIDG